MSLEKMATLTAAACLRHVIHQRAASGCVTVCVCEECGASRRHLAFVLEGEAGFYPWHYWRGWAEGVSADAVADAANAILGVDAERLILSSMWGRPRNRERE